MARSSDLRAPMSSISTIALSGLNAAASRLQVSASNVANSQTTGALPTAHGTVPARAAQASFANQDGLIPAPNVDLAQEFVGQLLASYSFAANAAVLRADDQNNKA